MSDKEIIENASGEAGEDGNTNTNDKEKEKDIFGSDSESDAEAEQEVPAPTATVTEETSSTNAMKSIFGDDSDSDSDNDNDNGSASNEQIKDEKPVIAMKTENGENNMDFMYEEDISTSSQPKKKATYAKICIPDTKKISDQASTFTLRLPNFLKLQTNPYNKQLHHEEAEASLFAGATSMIRWRHKLNQNGDVELDEKGLPVKESNARLVKWSDGSYQVLVGQEVFDSSTFPVVDSYLYTQRKSSAPDVSDPASASLPKEEREEIKTDTSLECVGAATERLVLRPSSVVSAAHGRLSLAIAEKYSRKTKIKGREYGSVIINAEKDTDARAAAINEDLRRERRRRAQMDSAAQGGGGQRYSKPSMSSRFMEEEEGFDSTSLRDLKKSKKFKPSSRYASDDEEDDMEDEEEDEDDDGFIVNDDDMEDEDEDEKSQGSDHSDSDNDQRVSSKKVKSSKKSKSVSKMEVELDSSDQDDFETVKPKKRFQENTEEDSKGGGDEERPTLKKRRRVAIVDSDDDDE